MQTAVITKGSKAHKLLRRAAPTVSPVGKLVKSEGQTTMANLMLCLEHQHQLPLHILTAGLLLPANHQNHTFLA